nr:hypothetical protein GCM10020092_017460 [Actinoplanes digitatis]
MSRRAGPPSRSPGTWRRPRHTHSPARAERRDSGDDHATAAANLLCRGLLAEPEPELADALFAKGLLGLSVLAESADQPLSGVPLTDVLLDAWRAGRLSASEERLPRLSLRDARTAATLLRNAARALSVPVPAVDLVHCVGGTTPLLAALAGRWRTGIPLLLTEARAPVARPRAARSGSRPRCARCCAGSAGRSPAPGTPRPG